MQPLGGDKTTTINFGSDPITVSKHGASGPREQDNFERFAQARRVREEDRHNIKLQLDQARQLSK